MERSLFIHRLLVMIGISSSSSLMISSCSNDEDQEEVEEVLTEEEMAYLILKEKTSKNGSFLEGKILYVDTTHENYSKLLSVGEFINDNDHYVLLLRKTDEELLAFSNCCPHLGTSNRWSYSIGGFRCANHGNSYGTETGFVANCNSNNTSGNLKQYTTSLNKDILTVNFDS